MIHPILFRTSPQPMKPPRTTNNRMKRLLIPAILTESIVGGLLLRLPESPAKYVAGAVLACILFLTLMAVLIVAIANQK